MVPTKAQKVGEQVRQIAAAGVEAGQLAGVRPTQTMDKREDALQQRRAVQRVDVQACHRSHRPTGTQVNACANSCSGTYHPPAGAGPRGDLIATRTPRAPVGSGAGRRARRSRRAAAAPERAFAQSRSTSAALLPVNRGAGKKGDTGALEGGSDPMPDATTYAVGLGRPDTKGEHEGTFCAPIAVRVCATRRC